MATTKRKSTKKTTRVTTRKKAPQAPSVFDYLRFGESYTSLVLGIVVVIIATVLLLAFVHNRQAGKMLQQTQQAQSHDEPIQISGDVALTITQEQAKPTVVPTKASSLIPTKSPKNASGKTYTVVAGDNLWSIAEKTYQSGYKWVDIAKANHLTDPSDIHAGNKLVLPKVTPEVATISKPQEKVTIFITPTKLPLPSVTSTPMPEVFAQKINGATYTIVAGDSLWTIAVRAYGDGYRWPDIAKANSLQNNPGLIHSGNKIKIPRK